MDKHREAFENWISQQDWFYNYMGNRTKEEILSFDDENGTYHFLTQQKCWEAWQSRQAEIDEKNKRIEAISLILDGLKNAKYMHSQNKAYNSILIEKLEKALRGEHE